MNRFTLHHGDSREVLKTLAEASVDSIVTDPPYGLSREPDMAEVLRHWLAGDDYTHTGAGFMGRAWDSFVPGPAFWREAMRVLKPGGHVLAFSGTRTYDMAVLAMRLAGFEIRDQLAWVYGSGFPKSLDVSKAIDKHGPSGQVPFAEFAAHYEQQRKAKGLTHAQVCAAGGWHGTVNHGGSSVNWANGYGMPTVEQWAVLQPLLGLGDQWKVRVEREQYEREVVGQGFRVRRDSTVNIAGNSDGAYDLTAPGSDAARQWSGWGTALKPAWEPIVLARKPLLGTVAANVLAHGTGALNIDACRIAPQGEGDYAYAPGAEYEGRERQSGFKLSAGRLSDIGRWPANLAHDGSDEVVAGFPVTKSGALTAAQQVKGGFAGTVNAYGTAATGGTNEYMASEGSAARFFYCAKASKRDRDEGLDHLSEVHRPNGNKWTDQDYRVARGERPPTFESGPRRNVHPTVKPTDLMRWLIRLVTPAGGLVLDPFMGSGSTGKAAMLEGMRFVGIDLTADYIDIARARIDFAARMGHQPSLMEVT